MTPNNPIDTIRNALEYYSSLSKAVTKADDALEALSTLEAGVPDVEALKLEVFEAVKDEIIAGETVEGLGDVKIILDCLISRGYLKQPVKDDNGLASYILDPALPDYIRDLDIINTYGNELDRIARIKQFIVRLREKAKPAPDQQADKGEKE